jgi:hypothetical protein
LPAPMMLMVVMTCSFAVWDELVVSVLLA